MSTKKQFAYQEDMPYAREPLKSLYVCQRIFTTLVMVGWWALYYSIMPRSYRPRPSWSVKCCIAVNFTRRIYRVTELAGVTWGTRDPDQPCDNRKLKRTRFEWVDPLPEELRTGVIADPQVPFKRVGCFVWPRERPKIIPTCPGKEETHSDDTLMDGGEFEEAAGEVPVIGIFLHGGGYCHMSAHENAPTSQIPERLMRDKVFTEIHAVEYRLLQHAPFPAAVQDAAAVYAHIVQRHQRHGHKKPTHAFPETPSCYVPRPHADTDYLVDTPEPRALLQRTFLGHNPVETMHSPYVSPTSSRVLRAFYGDAFAESVADLTIAQLDDQQRQYLRTMCSVPATPVPATPIIGGGGILNGHGHTKPPLISRPPEAASEEQDRSPTSLAHPIIASPRGLSLFSEFPKTCVVLGDAERLEREVMRLVGAMERDGVDVHTIWVKDAPHDVLMMKWWDEGVRDAVWAQVEEWVRRV
ncbi:hypothetical protein BN946_scf184569.g62 [Trametes cinnabarina]|uniref:Alpha/beta hydrolase fold-3 domain-containing protein n=1 Tax=Pycnoporus cinnabarinus TaxID=5643 RepID=A0A060SE16_PYCCI|nr:hypothetical protein BN946_scf184569.g62 [Trametes cinnabarina]